MKKSLLFLSLGFWFYFSAAIAMIDPAKGAMYDVSMPFEKEKEPMELELRDHSRSVKNDSALIQSSSLSQHALPTSSSLNSPGLPSIAHVFPQIIPPATLMSTIATLRREGLSSSGQDCEGKDSSSHHYKYLGDDVQLQACHRRVKSAPDYFPNYCPRAKRTIDADDCCDDICYECCCVKDGCICCGTSVLIGFLIWLKSNTGSVQE